MDDLFPEDHIKALFPDPEWYALWTTKHLEPFVPKRGSESFMPMLEVHCLQDDGSRQIVVMMLAVDGFNDWATRRALLRKLGAQWSIDGWQVLALRFATEAWLREFTEEEEQVRGDRLVETYDDKQEVLMVQGKTLDGRIAMARAELLRDKVGRIRAVRPWQVLHDTGDGNPGLRSQILDAAWDGYLRTMAERRGWTQGDPHC